MGFDDAQKISRLNAPSFNGSEVAWKAWKERNTWSKVTGGELVKNPSILKLVFLSRTQEFQL